MSKKEFGIKFSETEHGFSIEVSGDEEIIKVHREMANAWKDFMQSVQKVGKVHRNHFSQHWHAGEGHPSHHGCKCNEDATANSDSKQNPTTE